MADQIYCIRCGREIKDGLLYCDRCGQSVAKSKEQQSKIKSKRARAEEIHREQINRKKLREAKEKKKQIKRRKARRRAVTLCVIVGILILGVVCAVCAYIAMSGNSSIKSVDDVVNEDIAQSSPAATTSQSTTSAVSSNPNMSFRIYEYGGISCPYPESFESVPSANDELMRLIDEVGGAVITISHMAVSGAARDMMTAYYDEVSQLGKVTENRSGSDGYIVTYETDTTIFHRKCVIKDNVALMYNFEYDKSSAKVKDYESCIENLDETFTSGQDNQ